MKPIRTGLLVLVVLVLLGFNALVAAFTPSRPLPLRHQNAMRMSYRGDDKGPLIPPTDDDLEALERRLTPSVAAWLRLASAVVIGGAYLASPVMGTCPHAWTCIQPGQLGFAHYDRIHQYIHETAPRPAEAVTSTTVLTGNVMEATCLGT